MVATRCARRRRAGERDVSVTFADERDGRVTFAAESTATRPDGGFPAFECALTASGVR